ncbi:MAG: DUF2793 domain-containing protein [Pseudomonadota bacterium]
MASSTQLQLPYVEAAQAQKHVTVNESLRKLDALVQLSVVSRTLTAPPPSPVEGARYLAPAGATGAWAGRDNEIAAYQDGAWAFFPPRAGWRLYSEADDADYVYDGAAWRAGVPGGLLAGDTAGGGFRAMALSEDHTLAAAAFSDTSMQIPNRAIVLGVTGRVLTAVGGATSWDLGVAGATDRYGSSIGAAAGSTVNGPSSAPTAYYGATPLRLTANGGAFSSGVVRLTLCYLLMDTPGA